MSDVKRYDCNGMECSKDYSHMRFVLASDYDALVQRCAELEKHVTEWFCNKCRTVHTQPVGLSLACKTPGCSGLLRPSSYEQRRVEVERDTLRAEVVAYQAALADERGRHATAEMALRAEVERLRQFVEFVRHAPVSSGVCCCGDYMTNHPDPMCCGHSAVDEWDNALLGWLKELGVEQ